MTSMLELVEASAGVYPLSYGPGIRDAPTLPGWHSRGVDFVTAVLPSRGTHTSFAISSFATQCTSSYPRTQHAFPRTYPKKGKYTLHAQGKMANTMTIQEQIEMSGLEIISSLSSSSSSLSSQLQWNSTNQWSPLLGGGWAYQACMTIVSGNENGSGGQTIVVIGGQMLRGENTNPVIVWDPSTMEWRNGPSLNDRRCDLVAVVCHDKVYAIGGWGHTNNYNNNTTLDTMESIQVSSLLETMKTLMMTRQNNNQWTRLQCCLSSP